MKSKGPVDFFLGVFLELGVAFCLLFFLPHVPWHWLPGENGGKTNSVNSPSAVPGIAVTDRRTSLFPPQSEFARPLLSLPVQSRREAPALLATEEDPALVSPASAPLASRAPADARGSFYRPRLPRQYNY
jgi:hypothetical protein